MIEANLWSEFFLDRNVRFPNMPRLIEDISIYDAPYGLGIQFRGGPKKLVIKGKASSELFGVLRDKLIGTQKLDEIFEDLKGSYDVNDIATILKLLHAHHLLVDGEKLESDSVGVSSQVKYFNRLVGRTGFNESGNQISESLCNAKVLLMASEGVIPDLLHNLTLANIRNVGLMFLQTEDQVKNYQSYFPFPLMTEYDITKLDDESILNPLHLKSDDYQYVIVGLENPSRSFLTSINDFCINRSLPVLFMSLVENTFELGPYVIPKASACHTCYILRMNSFNQDALYENIYYDGLTSLKQTVDREIRGIDPVSVNIASGLLVSDFVRIVSGLSQPTLINHITEYDSVSGHTKNYPIVRVPGCPSCTN